MGDRRRIHFRTSGDYDHPPATVTLAEHSMNNLYRLGRTLDRQREESREEADAARHERWINLPGMRRRRMLRATGTHPPTYEGRTAGWFRDEDSPDEEERPRQAKRRKLNSVQSVEKAYRYGHYGQVESGRLKLDLWSCDGGVHQGRASVFHGPANILKHDQSVYSSKTPHCNIILRHHDETAFTLEKLVIIAPGKGFNAPVKHGVACIAMEYKNLMPLAADALLYNTSLHAAEDNSGDGDEEDEEDEPLDFFEGLRDPEVLAALPRSAPRSTNDADEWPPIGAGAPPWSGIPPPLPSANHNSNRDGRAWDLSSVSAVWPPLEPSRPTRDEILEPGPTEELALDSGFRVIMEYDHPVGWPEEPTAWSVLGDRQRRALIAGSQADAQDASDTEPWDPRYTSSISRTQRAPGSLAVPPTRSCSAQTSSSSRHTSADVTQVPFHLRDGRTRVAMTFDPPISGTCILLQLHSAHSAPNVDVQTVIAFGYAGPRFFPAEKMR